MLYSGRLTVSILATLLAALIPALVSGGLPHPGGSSRAQLKGLAASEQSTQTGIDVGAVIETVRHRVAPVGGRPGILRAEDRVYRADFDESGVAVTLRSHRSRRPPTEATQFEAEPALRVRTVVASRGGTSFPISPARWRPHGNEARRTLATGLSERVSARAGELGWNFLLASPPNGSGALRIEADLETAGAPTRLGRGWRLPLPQARSLRLGELAVRDAGGGELYRSAPGATQRRVMLEVPARVLTRARYPLTLDVIVSPEYPVSEQVVSGPAPSFQQFPALDYDGTNYLIVWQDYRSGEPDIYGARVTPTGTVLDGAGIAISTAPGGQIQPSLAFDGTNYLVTWSDARTGPANVYGARVSTAGTVLDPVGIAISTGPLARSSPAVAFDGTNYLVVWEDRRANGLTSDVYGSRVSSAGAVLDPAGIPISTAADDQTQPEVAFDGTNYLVAWEDSRAGSTYDVYGARVTAAGAVLDPAGIPISTVANDTFPNPPAVAFDGTNYLVAWEDRRSGANDIYGARVSPGGTVLDASGIAISTATDRQDEPAIAFDGTNYLVAWSDERAGFTNADVYGARVSQAGAVLDPAGIPISTAGDVQDTPTLAFDGTNYFVGWEDSRAGIDVYGAPVTPAGKVLEPDGIIVSTAVNSLVRPAVSFDGSNFLVVWEDDRLSPPSPDIYGARVTLSGKILDPAGIPISRAAGWQSQPEIAFDGTNYLVVWQGGCAETCAARVSSGGTVLDPGGIAIANGSWPAVAFDGTNYLVAWTGPSRIYVARVSQAGVVLDPGGIPLPGGGMYLYEFEPSVAFDGTNYLVVWQEATDVGGQDHILGARVSPSGAVLEAMTITLLGGPAETSPVVASAGTNSLVVWRDYRSAAGDIYGSLVSSGGTVRGDIPISNAPGEQRAAALAFDGTNYFVAWQDYRSGTTYDVFGTRVSTSGTVLEPAGLGIATNPSSSEAAPDVAPGPRLPGLHRDAPRGRRMAVGYQRNVMQVPYGGVNRVLVRFVDTPPSVGFSR
jgi:hypothetical protein